MIVPTNQGDDISNGRSSIWNTFSDVKETGETYVAKTMLNFVDDWNDNNYQNLDNILFLNTIITSKDTDGDGVDDSADNCPTIPGPATNDGCPQTVSSFEEEFGTKQSPSLSNWSNTGDVSWTVQSPDESEVPNHSRYTNVVAHTDDCDENCVLTLLNNIDLTQFSQPKLEFYRFIDASFDDTEDYMLVEGTDNGSTWIQIAKYGESFGDTDENQWIKESYDLSSFSSNTFKLRFTVVSDSSSENAEIDQVKIVEGNPPDTTAPSISITAPTNNQIIISSSVAITGTAVDSQSGIGNVKVSFDGGAPIITTGTSSWSHTFTGLTNDSHTITATATNGVGLSSSQSVTFTINTSAIPDAPTGLVANAVSPTQIDIVWSTPNNDGGSSITGYFIERNLNGAGFITLVSDTASALTTYSDKTLNPEDISQYRVSAINQIGTSIPSNVASVTTNVITKTIQSSTNSGTIVISASSGFLSYTSSVDESTLPMIGKPSTISFPHGLLSWNVTGLNNGSSITLSVTYPDNISANSQYWKIINDSWINATSILGSNDGDNTITLTLIDGSIFDADNTVNGSIADPGGITIVQPDVILLSENFDGLSSVLKSATDESIDGIGWTHDTPTGWSITSSEHTKNNGVTEWRGWSFVTPDFWQSADTQGRSAFLNGTGIIAVADPDEWNDKGNPASTGTFNSTLSTPEITVSGYDTIYLGFNSHYLQYGSQKGEVSVSYDGGVTFITLDSFTADESEDDGIWHFEEYSLANYTSTQFKLKFIATSSSNSEDIEIDNLRIYDAYIPTDTTISLIIESINDITISEGQTHIVTVSATTTDQSPITYSLTQKPSFVTITNNTITISPDYYNAGNYTITAQAISKNQTSTVPFDVTVYDSQPTGYLSATVDNYSSILEVVEGEPFIVKFQYSENLSKTGWVCFEMIDSDGNKVKKNADIKLWNDPSQYSFDGVSWGGDSYNDKVFYGTCKYITGDQLWLSIPTFVDYDETESDEVYYLKIREDRNNPQFEPKLIPLTIKESGRGHPVITVDVDSSTLVVTEGESFVVSFQYDYTLSKTEWASFDVIDSDGNKVRDNENIKLWNDPNLFSYDNGIKWGGPGYYDKVYYGSYKYILGDSISVKIPTKINDDVTQGDKTYKLKVTVRNNEATIIFPQVDLTIQDR
ncbi:MAG: thrombospondin type 3 repeat-containing protein [Nitrosopumilus sp.]|nr:Ig-like domain-containing protein [Nitrosopumilus sp.]NRA04579.1 thrombospondin type 3 repeat-containing protein [Nitrosopumilus sp.]